MKPHRLLDLDFDEVSLVDRPANPGARVVLYKRSNETVPDAGNPAGDHVSKGKDNPMPADDAKKVADLEKSVADLTKSVTDLTSKLEKAEADKNEAQAIAKMSDAEREYLKGIKGDDRKEFLEMTAAKRRKLVKAAEDDDEVLKVAGQEIRKSAVGESAFEVMKAQQAQLNEQAEAIKKAAEKSEMDALTKRAADEFGHLPGEAVVKAKVLKAVAGMDDETRKALDEMLKAGEEAIKGAFKTIGVRKGEVVGSAEEKLEKMAKDKAEKDGITYAKAYQAVLDTPEGSNLYSKSLEAA